MLTETGRVVGIDADGLWVQTMRRSTGNACTAQREDLAAVVGAAGSLALGFVLVRWHNLRHRGDRSFHPVLLGIVSSREDPITLR